MSTPTDSSSPSTAAYRNTLWDNDLPVGDSPPLPAWPLKLSIVAYVLWMTFLVAMLILRLTYSH